METKTLLATNLLKTMKSILYDDTTKVTTLRSYYKRMFNIAFIWDSHFLLDLEPKVGQLFTY